MTTSTKKITAADITDDLIKELKSKHGKIWKYTSSDSLKVGLFKAPDRTALDASIALQKSNPVKSDELLAKATFLGGDEDLITDNKYFMGMRLFLGHLIELVAGEFTEL